MLLVDFDKNRIPLKQLHILLLYHSQKKKNENFQSAWLNEIWIINDMLYIYSFTYLAHRTHVHADMFSHTTTSNFPRIQFFPWNERLYTVFRIIIAIWFFFLSKDSALLAREHIWVAVRCRDSLLIICIIYSMNEMSFSKVWHRTANTH